ncbi:putative E3 ubiquitin-protein ligase ORTHRUS 2 [Cocos nucifera]|nr:putative E3 ubiquitin-protein ligase ORTHRUS 2 [Cocos nucifera]
MAPACDLPCDGDGVCMVCKATPPEAEVILCRTCATPWHAPCLARPPETLASVADWECPDCSPSAAASIPAPIAALSGASGDLIASIRAIEADTSLTEEEKARRRQALVSGAPQAVEEEEKGKKKKAEGEDDDVLDLFDEKFKCAFCMQLPERPVTVSTDFPPFSIPPSFLAKSDG